MNYLVAEKIGLPDFDDEGYAVGTTIVDAGGQMLTDEILAAHGQSPEQIQSLIDCGALVPVV